MSDLTQTIELVQRAQQGEQDALNRLFARYYERVRSIVRLRLGPSDALRRRLDSGDILQQTFLTAVRKFDQFDMRTEASLINWLATLAQHQITDAAEYHGAQKRQAGLECSIDSSSADQDDGAPRFDLEGLTDTPSRQLAAIEDKELLHDAILELPPDDRELLILRNYEGHAWKEIAERTDRPTPDAARVKHAQVLARLLLILQKKRGQ